MKAGQWDVLGMRLAVLLTWSEDGWVAIATDITKPQTAGGGKVGLVKRETVQTVQTGSYQSVTHTYINWLNLESIDFQRGWDFTAWLHQSPLLFIASHTLDEGCGLRENKAL